MSLWTVVAALLTLTALFAYINHRLLCLPPSIGVMSVALAFSLGLLALVSGGFALANASGVSAPLVTVVAGLIVGQHGRRAMSRLTRNHLDLFWHLVDEILNAVLFVLIGLEVLAMRFHERYLGAMLALVPLVLAARLVSVGLPYMLLRRRYPFAPSAFGIMIWGGLRGGLSVAMALSLPAGPERELLVAVTYAVVVFGLLVQGTSLAWLLGKRAEGSPPTISGYEEPEETLSR